MLMMLFFQRDSDFCVVYREYMVLSLLVWLFWRIITVVEVFLATVSSFCFHVLVTSY